MVVPLIALSLLITNSVWPSSIFCASPAFDPRVSPSIKVSEILGVKDIYEYLFYTYVKNLIVSIVFSLSGACSVELLNLRVDVVDLCAYILYDLSL